MHFGASGKAAQTAQGQGHHWSNWVHNYGSLGHAEDKYPAEMSFLLFGWFRGGEREVLMWGVFLGSGFFGVSWLQFFVWVFFFWVWFLVFCQGFLEFVCLFFGAFCVLCGDFFCLFFPLLRCLAQLSRELPNMGCAAQSAFQEMSLRGN